MENGDRRKKLLHKLDRIEKLSHGSKWSRLVQSPYKYLSALFFREIIFRFTHKDRKAIAETFWGDRLQIRLPASMDIYLLTAKSHDSEIRLARFILSHVGAGDQFLDIGAHNGYYSLLAANSTGTRGRVMAVEPGKAAFSLLEKNVKDSRNIDSFNLALHDSDGYVELSEFPAGYAEYTTLHPGQFERESWFSKNRPKKYQVRSVTGDRLLQECAALPGMIKIDVEGAEYQVIKGLQGFLETNNPYVAMEFVSRARSNDNHQRADYLLREFGYRVFSILADGGLSPVIGTTVDHVEKSGLESDNIVYKKIISFPDNTTANG
jgi:FkbM family methyltransferase